MHYHLFKKFNIKLYSKNLAFHGGGKCVVMAERCALSFFHLSEGIVPAQRCVVWLEEKMFFKKCLSVRMGRFKDKGKKHI